MKLIVYPDPILFEKSDICNQSELDWIKKQVPQMKEIMINNNGVGLAAVQVGILKTFCIILSHNSQLGDKNSEVDLIINPVIVEESKEIIKAQEGCLSLPLFYEYIERPESVTATFYDDAWAERTAVFHGMKARCLKHEIDHMMGNPLVNQVSIMKKQMWLKRINKRGLL